MNKILILIQCPDRVGIVSAITGMLAVGHWNIIVMREFVDVGNQRFFARIECEGGEWSQLEGLEYELKKSLGKEGTIRVSTHAIPKKIVVLVTKEFHCLGEILVRNFFNRLGAEVTAVIGNRNSLASFVERFSIPYFYIPHENKSKAQFEAELLAHLTPLKPDYIILAKFMQILSASFVETFPNRIINIHHSFLPAFVGANPYKKAFERGVKVIGATAHFVTADLDNGPIISQATIPVNHNYDANQMRIRGQEIEKGVLNSAMNLVFSDKVFVMGNKTIILE